MAVWISFPAVIVFTALSLVLLRRIVAQCGMRGFIGYAVLNLPVVLSFAGVLFVTRASQTNTVLVDYWEDCFIDWHHPLGLPMWLLRAPMECAITSSLAVGQSFWRRR